eukprot:g559.t1
MVLADLGNKIGAALRDLSKVTVIDEEVLKVLLRDICKALLEADINVSIVQEIRGNIKKIVDLEELSAGTNKRKMLQDAIFRELVNMIDPGVAPYEMKKGKQNVIMFVGLQGSGKTTTIAKYANYYSKQGYKCAMVCADTFRAGAFDQLKQNARRLGVPFYGSYTEADPVKIAEDGVKEFKAEGIEVIIVDTSGRHKQQADLFTEMEEVSEAVSPDDVVFVMDSTIGQAVHDQATAFKSSVKVGSVICTKLDGHAKGGGALSAVAATESPITFIGEGEHFDDLEAFDARSFVSRMLGMGDVAGLYNKIKDNIGLDAQPELVERFKKGVFTLRDMYEQFQNVLKLGNMSTIMSMIPGMSNMMQGQEKDGAKRIQQFLTVMDSMTVAELDGEAEMSNDRIIRVSRGGGVAVELTLQLLKTHKQFEKMVGKMGKTGLMKGDDVLNKQMQRNPNMVMQQMAKSIDPRMLQQMGGMGNMMNMMKQMSKMDAGQMGEMMSQMGGMGGMGGMMGGGGGGRRGKRG